VGGDNREDQQEKSVLMMEGHNAVRTWSGVLIVSGDLAQSKDQEVRLRVKKGDQRYFLWKGNLVLVIRFSVVYFPEAGRK